ncbi:MAG: Uma2 family endonuclease [Hyphomicrobiaceae bacterium]|nr:Uma2 family endonuclease [Hyphomicrobiaceae bacterium]
MSVAPRKPNRASEEEYLAFEHPAATRHELVGGVIYAMVGGTDRHNLIFGNIALLHRDAPETSQVFTAQTKLRVALADEVDYVSPDVCVARVDDDRNRHYREQPCLIVEAISPSTEREDRRDKFLADARLPSLQEYVLVTQDAPQVEIMRRRSACIPEFAFLQDQLRLESVDLSYSVTDFYRRIPF